MMSTGLMISVTDVPSNKPSVSSDAMVTLAQGPGFSELKRTLRHFPDTEATQHLVEVTTTSVR